MDEKFKHSLWKKIEWKIIGLIPRAHRKYYYNRRRGYWEFGFRSLFIPYGVLRELYQMRAKKRQRAMRKTFTRKKKNGLYMVLAGKQRGTCANCPSQTNLTIDHIVPLSKGGNNRRKNLQLLCEECHRKKDNHQPKPKQPDNHETTSSWRRAWSRLLERGRRS